MHTLVAFSIFNRQKQELFIASASNENGLSIYIPNSYLEVLIGKIIQTNEAQIFDTAAYTFYDVKHQASTATANNKDFVLTIINKEYQKRRLRNALSNTAVPFDSSFIIKRSIRLAYKDNIVTVQTNGMNSNSISLFNTSLKNFAVDYLDKQNPYHTEGSPTIFFNSKSIGITFLKSSAEFKTLCENLDNQSQYQNIGFSAVFSFDYISSYVKDKNIHLQAPSSFSADLFVQDLIFSKVNENIMKLQFSLNSSSTAFLSAILKVDADVDKSTNSIMQLSNYQYDGTTLSSFQKKQMESTIAKVKEQAAQGLTGKPLSAQMRSIQIRFSAGARLFITTAANDGFFRYQPNHLITTINLF